MMKLSRLAGIGLVATTLLSGNSPLAASDPKTINLYGQGPLESWQVFFENYETQQALQGTSGALPKGDVKVQVADKDAKGDALVITWKDTWRGALSLENGKPLDLSAYMQNGVLTLDLKINELAKGGVSFKMECQKQGCDRIVPFTMTARDLRDKDWQKVYALNTMKTVLPRLACLSRWKLVAQVRLRLPMFNCLRKRLKIRNSRLVLITKPYR
jgi:hypothetical protein